MGRDTDLHKAAYKGDITELEMLLAEEGANVNELGAQDRTPLHRAVGGKSDKTTAFLIEKGADPNLQDNAGRTPLHWAAIVDASECAAVLLDKGAAINPLTNTGKTPLHMGAEAGNLTTVKFIIAKGADVTIKDAKGQMAYDLAKSKGHKEVMQALKGDSGGCCVLM